jgi:hypothetical protein
VASRSRSRGKSWGGELDGRDRREENSALLPKPYTVEQLQTTLTLHFGIKPKVR